MNKMNEIPKSAEYLQMIETIQHKDMLSNKTNILDQLFSKLDDIDVQLILRETNMEILVPALAGASGKVAFRVFQNMGDRGALILQEDIEYYLKNHDLYNIVEAQKKMNVIYSTLKKSAKIEK